MTNGELPADRDLDAFLPAAARRISTLYWSPVRVASRAAAIFAALGVSRVLDLGSGAGKFCVVAGAQAPRIDFVGVEHRPHLVAAARALAEAVGATNVAFTQGDASLPPEARFDGFYAFNPFAENSLMALGQVDQTVELSPLRRLVDVLRVERWLAARPDGAVLVTYHGLGGPIPSSYECVHHELVGTDRLRAWRKMHAPTKDRYWFEDRADVRVVTLDEVAQQIVPKQRARPKHVGS